MSTLFQPGARFPRMNRKWLNPATGSLTVVPDWGGDDLKLGTVRGAVRQLGLSWDEFGRA